MRVIIVLLDRLHEGVVGILISNLMSKISFVTFYFFYLFYNQDKTKQHRNE
jgi:hypothetical protein